MRVAVNGVRLFVEVLGTRLVVDGPRMRERPTVVALHGGPTDHEHMREMLGPLSDIAQVVLYDHRGCGRSDRGDPASWTLEQWGDDVRGLCDALGIERPIVIGGSFGGFVAQAYAIRHPGHAARLGLVVTGPRRHVPTSIEGFRKQGGDAAADAFAAFQRDLNPQTYAGFMTHCRALYTRQRIVDTEAASRATVNPALAARAFALEFDFRPDLARVTSPVLILGGDLDPILPPVFQDELEQALVNAPVRRIRLHDSSHFAHLDEPERYFGALRAFVSGEMAF